MQFHLSLTKNTLEFHFNGQILTLLLEKELPFLTSRPNSRLSFKKLHITLLNKSERSFILKSDSATLFILSEMIYFT